MSGNFSDIAGIGVDSMLAFSNETVSFDSKTGAYSSLAGVSAAILEDTRVEGDYTTESYIKVYEVLVENDEDIDKIQKGDFCTLDEPDTKHIILDIEPVDNVAKTFVLRFDNVD